MKKYLKLDIDIKQVLKIFVFVFIICSVSLILVSMIPDKKIDNNIEKSIHIMNKEGDYPTILNKNSKYYQLDNFTEAVLLNFIYNCDSSKPLECTFAEKTYKSDDGTGLQNANLMLKEVGRNSAFSGGEKGYYNLRSSYWLGIRIIYMPLLTFMNYYQIRYLIFSLGILLSIFTAITIVRKLNWKYAIAFLLSLIITKYYVGLLVSTHAFVYILTFLGMDYILLKKKKVNYFNFMFIIGMLTTYFDWFSIPLLSWGFITITILLKEYQENKKIDFSELFNIIFQTGFAWCLGYASLLIFRQLFCYFIAGNEAIKYFTNRIADNTGAKSNSIINTIGRTLKNILNGIIPIYMESISRLAIVLVILMIVFLILLLICIKLLKRKMHIGMLLLLISISPFVWALVFSKFHSVHGWFAYRTLGISVFAIILILLFFIDYIIKSKKNTIKKIKNNNAVRFLVVGGISTLLDFTIYMLLSLKINLIIAKSCSMLCACIFSFFVNKNWTFNNEEKINYKMIIAYIITQIINIGVNTSVNYLMYNFSKLKTISFVIATFMAMIVNYLLQNFVVFKGEKKYEVLNCYSLL